VRSVRIRIGIDDKKNIKYLWLVREFLKYNASKSTIPRVGVHDDKDNNSAELNRKKASC
jgi:hypothetical protein